MPKSVRLTKFTGTVRKNSKGQVVIEGRGAARKTGGGTRKVGRRNAARSRKNPAPKRTSDKTPMGKPMYRLSIGGGRFAFGTRKEMLAMAKRMKKK
jgi:hypothetical protein